MENGGEDEDELNFENDNLAKHTKLERTVEDYETWITEDGE